MNSNMLNTVVMTHIGKINRSCQDFFENVCHERRKGGNILCDDVAMQEFNFQNFLYENLFLRTSYTSSISKVHCSSSSAERESFLLTSPPPSSSEIVALWETVYVALW